MNYKLMKKKSYKIFVPKWNEALMLEDNTTRNCITCRSTVRTEASRRLRQTQN
jgi:hypothetical protein